MKQGDTQDAVIVRDRAGRRDFIRTGSALLLAGGAMAIAQRSRANECDRAPEPGQQKQAGNGSDSDAGASADPIGCGRQEPPKISSLEPGGIAAPVGVVRVKA